MSVSLGFRPPRSGAGSARLRTILHHCRADLAWLRRDQDPNARRPAADVRDVQQRLTRLTSRLEDAAGMLDRALDDPQPPAAPASETADILAREADHRIKNSLQTVIALLSQQAAQAAQPALRDALGIAAGRVEAVAQVHEMLHVTADQDRAAPLLDLGRYLDRVCAALRKALDLDGERHTLQVVLESLPVSPATAQQVGLIVTELVTNAVRHGLGPEQGRIWIAGTARSDGTYQLCIEDDGRGLPAGFDIRDRSAGLGLRVVSLLADQTGARLAADRRLGARFTLTLPPSAS